MNLSPPSSFPNPQFFAVRSQQPHIPLPLLSNSPPRRGKNRIKYFAELALKLAEDGRFKDLLLLAENVMASDEVKLFDFIALVNVELVSAGIRRVIKEKKASEVVQLLRSLEKLGISPLDLLSGAGSEVISEVVRRNVMSGELEEVVVFELLLGFLACCGGGGSSFDGSPIVLKGDPAWI